MQEQSPFYASVGHALQAIRKSKGLGQEAIATKLGVTQSNYSQIESGKISISLFQFIQIANILEVTPFMLLTIAGISDYYKFEQAEYAQSLTELRDTLMRAKSGNSESAKELLRRISDLLDGSSPARASED